MALVHERSTQTSRSRGERRPPSTRSTRGGPSNRQPLGRQFSFGNEIDVSHVMALVHERSTRTSRSRGERRPSSTGSTGEGLRNREPVGGEFSFGDEPEIGNVAALGDQQTEVDCRAGDAVRA
jgi:hypothetical protein